MIYTVGDSEVLDVNTASTLRRFFALMMDRLIISAFYLPVWIQVFESYFTRGYWEIDYKWLFVCFFLQFSYRWLFLRLLGATMGKLVLGLKVVNASKPSRPLSWFQCFLRTLTDHLSFFFGDGLRALAFLRFDRTHPSDWVSETRVIQMQPRWIAPRKRIVVGIILFLYLSALGFSSSYKLIQRIEWRDNHLTLTLIR